MISRLSRPAAVLGLLAAAMLAMLGASVAAQTPSTSVTKTVGQSATLTLAAPTTYVNGSPITGTITYNIYAVSGSCTASPVTLGAQLATGLAGLSWVSPAFTAAGTFCWVATAVNSGEESAPSNVVSAVVTQPAPNPPGATIS